MTDFRDEDWWALIGPAPRLLTSATEQTSHDKTRRLADVEQLGDVALRPGGELLMEYLRTEPVQMTGYLRHESWPIIVEGTTAIERHLEHDVETAARVVRAAVLVSLTWGEPWTVRSAPFRSNRIPPSVPESWPEPEHDPFGSSDALALIEAYPNETLPQVLPEWLHEGGAILDDDPVLWRAALMWHEALMLQSEHPSFSAVAYISSIETLSTSRWAKSRFEVPSGSRARVKLMLEQVELAGIAEIINTMYSARSGTAHGGRLFAYEGSRGAFSALTPKPLPTENGISWTLEADEEDLVHNFLHGVLNPLARASGPAQKSLGRPSFRRP